MKYRQKSKPSLFAGWGNGNVTSRAALFRASHTFAGAWKAYAAIIIGISLCIPLCLQGASAATTGSGGSVQHTAAVRPSAPSTQNAAAVRPSAPSTQNTAPVRPSASSTQHAAAVRPSASNTQNTAPVRLSAPSAVLMEAATGEILYDSNSHEKRKPASVTKIMTLLLIFEALDNGKFKLEDTVTVSEHAAGMGGSQVFLEAGETQNVETMIKCIAVASANDAAVAMAEFVSGSEEEFVNRMNSRAAELGMNDTHFVNCCGLDTDGHETTSYDIALMSRELITKHPQVFDYTKIWQENITHVTAKGASEFTLTNTNKLMRQYEYATGLKTGSTSLAKYCVSATARKDNMDLIAVVMAAPDPKTRFADAVALLDYGFANFYLYEDNGRPPLADLTVTKGVADSVPLEYAGDFQTLLETTQPASSVEATLKLPESAAAPLKKGDTAGYLHYSCNGEEIGKIPVVYAESIAKASLRDYFYRLLQQYAGAA